MENAVDEAGKPEFSAIPTFYAGTQFKSRMEAQCAVLFDKLGWGWEYEKFSLMLPDGTPFIPDFWIESQWLLVECRGYSSERGDRQLLSFSRMLGLAKGGAGRCLELELPNKNGEFYDFAVISDPPSQFGRDRAFSGNLFFVQCECGNWSLLDVRYCQNCWPEDGIPRYKSVFSLTVKNGILLVNGKPLVEVNLG
jgi:hypothetical protein